MKFKIKFLLLLGFLINIYNALIISSKTGNINIKNSVNEINYDENISFRDYDDDVYGLGLFNNDLITHNNRRSNINIINIICLRLGKNITTTIEVKGEETVLLRQYLQVS